MLRIRSVKTLAPLVAFAVMGSSRYSGPKTKSGNFVGLNFIQCEPRLPTVDVSLPQYKAAVVEEVVMADGSKYVGVRQDGQRCGEGESWDKKGHYKGSGVGNVKGGQGGFKFANGYTYEGQFDNDLLNGHGKMTLRDGEVFEGEFVNGVLQGQPRCLTFPWGRFEGDTLNNLPHGFGRKVYNDGVLEEGEFFEGLASGQFKRIDLEGTVLEGEFANNVITSGKATFTCGSVMEGTFIDYQLHGPGRMYLPGEYDFVGLFVNGNRHGPGRCTTADGSVCEETYVDDKLHGRTRRVYPNGNVNEVEYIHGVPQSASMHFKKSGDMITGTLVKLEQGQTLVNEDSEGKISALKVILHGPLKIVCSDGTVIEGICKCNRPYGVITTTHPDGSITVEDRTPRMNDKLKLLAEEQRLINWPKFKAALNIGISK